MCLVRVQEPLIARVLEQTSAGEPGSARPDGRRCSNRRQHHGSGRGYECIMGSLLLCSMFARLPGKHAAQSHSYGCVLPRLNAR